MLLLILYAEMHRGLVTVLLHRTMEVNVLWSYVSHLSARTSVHLEKRSGIQSESIIRISIGLTQTLIDLKGRLGNVHFPKRKKAVQTLRAPLFF